MMESLLDGDNMLETINELWMNGHAVFQGDAPRPLRFQEERVLQSQYSDGSDQEDEGPRRPDLDTIAELLRRVDPVDWTHSPIKQDTVTGDVEIILTKPGLNPEVTEFKPSTTEKGLDETVDVEKETIITAVEGKENDNQTPEVVKTAKVSRRQPPKHRNMAMQSLLKLRALHGKGDGDARRGSDASPVQLLRPDDFLPPPTPVEMVSEPQVELPKPSATLAEPALPAVSVIDPEAKEKVTRWLDAKSTKESPKKPAEKPTTDLCLSKPLTFVPKISPSGSGRGSPEPTPRVPPAAAPPPRAAGRGPTEHVASAKASAFYEKYNQNKKMKALAQPSDMFERELQNTVWAEVSKKLVAKEKKKQELAVEAEAT